MASVLSEWGIEGARRLGPVAGVLVVVDVLSFSTCVDIAVGAGAAVYPHVYGDPEAAGAAATALGAELAGPRGSGGYSLSPASLRGIAPGTRLLLPSPNGSAISAASCEAHVLAGCLRNARAVARAAAALAGGRPIAVIPAGERWPDGSLRPAIEDLLGAGAIVAALGMDASPEAEVAAAAFRGAGGRLAELIRGSVSGQELAGYGYPGDVALAAELDSSEAAPILKDGAFVGSGSA